MEIHSLDWIVYVLGIIIIYLIMRNPVSWERDLAMLVYSIIYAVIFLFLDWVDVVDYISDNISW